MKHTVTLLPGEGIGPEVSAATQRVLDASGVKIEWEILGARAENTDKKKVGAEGAERRAIESVSGIRWRWRAGWLAIAGGARSVNVARES
jgi:isocitrate/isopropylmalate dehydrogenase